MSSSVSDGRTPPPADQPSELGRQRARAPTARTDQTGEAPVYHDQQGEKPSWWPADRGFNP
eukprot:5362266-Amphidinium_carterae.1